jgi:hypothetical protein
MAKRIKEGRVNTLELQQDINEIILFLRNNPSMMEHLHVILKDPVLSMLLFEYCELSEANQEIFRDKMNEMVKNREQQPAELTRRIG